MAKKKPLLAVDFDGVLHSYTSGWTAADNVADPPVKGAIQFLRDALDFFDIAITSARSPHPGGVEAMQIWLAEHGLEADYRERLYWPLTKPAAFLTIDDRALLFTGNFPEPSRLLGFRTWTKGTPAEAQEFSLIMTEENDG